MDISKGQIQHQILVLLYEAMFAPGRRRHSNLHRFADENGYDRPRVLEAFDELTDSDFAQYFAAGGEAEITPEGILHAEDRGIIDEDLMAHQRQIRTKVLTALAELRERHGRHALIDWTHVVQEAGITEEDYHPNYLLLRAAGLMVTGHSARSVEITPAGRQAVEDYRRRCGIASELELLAELEGMTPQERGRRFERLLHGITEAEGWAVEPDVTIPGEQNDLILHQGNDYYLVEAKWENSPVSPEKVSRLAHKLSKRPGMKGILISMSGLTDEARKDVRDLLMQGRLVLLYGPGDVQAIARSEATFSDLLAEKTRMAMTRREVLIG